MITFDDLNANQRRAVEWSEGPVLVLAGPGSGKTVVLTLRVVRLLEESENASALALTFTNKAAAEMRDRLDRRLGAHTDRAQLCTFHSFAADILGQHGSHLGIRPDFLLLTQAEDRIAILEEVIDDLPDGDTGLPPDRNNLLHLIDRLFSESYSGEGPVVFADLHSSMVADRSFGCIVTLSSRPTASTSAACSISRHGSSAKSRRSHGWCVWAGRTSASTNSRTRTGRSTICFA